MIASPEGFGEHPEGEEDFLWWATLTYTPRIPYQEWRDLLEYSRLATLSHDIWDWIGKSSIDTSGQREDTYRLRLTFMMCCEAWGRGEEEAAYNMEQDALDYIQSIYN